jgi:osmotically-inducible protein OsmY
MPKPTFLLSPSLESTSSVGEAAPVRHSLFDTKDDFIRRIAPTGVAAIYFGSFSLSPQDAPLSRQALFKLSFLNRHFLQPGGVKIVVNRQTANLSGKIANRPLATMAEILALQIDGIRNVQNETQLPAEDANHAATPGHREKEAARETVQFLFATDQTLRSGVQVSQTDGHLTLLGEVGTASQKSWAEHLAEAAGAEIRSQINVNETAAAKPAAEPPLIDDESQQALVLFRLRLVRETEHVPVRVKANRGIVAVQGKVRTEALRQRVENIARSTLGLRELRSSLSIAT